MAEELTINVPHRLTRLTARERIEGGFHKVQEQIAGKGVSVEQVWQGDHMDFTATVMGQAVKGSLDVDDEQVHIRVALPWLLAKLAGPLQEKLASGTKLLLEKK